MRASSSSPPKLLRSPRRLGSQRPALRQAPGSIVHTGQRYVETAQLSGLSYNAAQLQSLESLPELPPEPTAPPLVTWLQITGLHDTALLQRIGQRYQLHPLTLEDIANTQQRPKLETFANYSYLTLRMFSLVDGQLDNEQLSIIVTGDTVLLFEERPGDVFDSLRTRLEHKQGYVRDSGANYLFYALLDAVIDGYMDVVEHYITLAEELELAILDDPSPALVQRLTMTRRDVLAMRRAILPLRDILSQVLRHPSELVGEAVRQYWRDALDHTVHVIDSTESLRERLSSLHDMYLSNLSYKMNEIMKVLTIISTIFIPLSFLVGLYGMNFDYMPELHYRYGYFVLWGIILSLVVVMMAYFKHRDWF